MHHMLYPGCRAPHDIYIDGELVERVMRLYRLDSERAAVQLAIERL